MNNQFVVDIDSGTVVSSEQKKLKEKMLDQNLTYDLEKSLEENQKTLDEHLKKKRQAAQKDKAKTKKKTEAQKEKPKKYKYPFTLHFAGENRDVSHIFKEDTEYTEKEITDKLFEHEFYEFGGNVSYDHHKDDNVLIPIFKQHKKG